MSYLPKTQGWKSFIKLVAAAQSPEQLDDLMQALFTYEERDQMALRIELLAELLRKQKPQRQIARELGVSIATITRGSNLLKSIKTKLRFFLEKELI